LCYNLGMLTIVSAPNFVLSEKAKPINPKGITEKKVKKLIDEMKQTLQAARNPEGVGLAAPQIGKSLQVFIAKPSTKSPFQTFINPQVRTLNNINLNTDKPQNPRESESKSVKISEDPKKLEGCLSLKDVWGEVSRSSKIVISYFDEEGNFHKRTFGGFIATIIQHEYDHLNGILFPKRVLEQNGKLFKSHKNKKGEDIFDEIEI